MGKEVVATDKAPAALGPYSQAIKAGNTLYVSGQIGLIPGEGKFAGDTIEEQTEQVMKNIGAVAEVLNFSKVSRPLHHRRTTR